ncbi:MAG: TIGR02281 family clan AA aspartic protease [Congregibacter sp.]
MRYACLLLMLYAPLGMAVDVVVEALLPGLAVLQIDGSRVTLREGQAVKGVRLIAADAKSALVDIAGKQQRLRVSQRISAQFSAPKRRSVTIPLDEQLQYLTNAEINGVGLPVIVDTGANVVALNSEHARAVGIAEHEGQKTQVTTAGSVVPARTVQLTSVSVGGIRIENVEATIIDGEFPRQILLGMSFLRHVELEDRSGVLTLRARW